MLKKPNKKVVFSLVFVLILVAGFFSWQNRKIKGSPDDYVIKETTKGIIVENKKAGLTLKAPEGWEAKKIETGEGMMIFYSPSIEGESQDDKITPPFESGCIIHASVIYEKMDFNYLKLQAKYNLALLDAKSEEFEEIIINSHQALKVIADTQKMGPAIGIDIPYEDEVYSFLLIFSFKDRNNCIQEFNSFLETISIN